MPEAVHPDFARATIAARTARYADEAVEASKPRWLKAMRRQKRIIQQVPALRPRPSG